MDASSRPGNRPGARTGSSRTSLCGSPSPNCTATRRSAYSRSAFLFVGGQRLLRSPSRAARRFSAATSSSKSSANSRSRALLGVPIRPVMALVRVCHGSRYRREWYSSAPGGTNAPALVTGSIGHANTSGRQMYPRSWGSTVPRGWISSRSMPRAHPQKRSGDRRKKGRQKYFTGTGQG